MKNEAIWTNYVNYTKDLTEFGRKLAFAAAAICWFFRTPNYTFPILILTALMLLVTYFFCDVLQYFTAALRWRQWIRSEEISRYQTTGSLEGDYEVPPHLDRLPFQLWLLKVIVLLTAFLFIVAEFIHRLAV